MPGRTHLLRNLFAIVIMTLTVGTIGYVLIEDNWSLFDAFYMTVITLTTIGFTEVHGLSDGGRMFTIVLIICGLGAAAAFVTQLAQLMVEGSVRELWRKRHMEKRLAGLKDHVIICGYGRIGQAIGQDLRDMNVPCVVVDRGEERVAAAQAAGLPIMLGNATSDLVLASAGISRAKVLVAALSQDAENVFVALTARDLNPDVVVIARVEDRAIETRMLRAGVNRVVCPAYLGGGQIARMIGEELGKEDTTSCHRRATDVLGYELNVYRNLHGRSLCVSEILELTGGAQAVAVVPKEGERVTDPASNTVVEDGDAVVLLVETAAQENHEDVESARRMDLSVGIPAIDEEHQKILSMIQRISAADRRDERRTVNEVLEELRVYTSRHFANEERLFLASGYPKAEEHVAEHRALMGKVDLMLADREYVHRSNLANLLEDWICHHILEVDKGYVEYLQTTAKV